MYKERGVIGLSRRDVRACFPIEETAPSREENKEKHIPPYSYQLIVFPLGNTYAYVFSSFFFVNYTHNVRLHSHSSFSRFMRACFLRSAHASLWRFQCSPLRHIIYTRCTAFLFLFVRLANEALPSPLLSSPSRIALNSIMTFVFHCLSLAPVLRGLSAWLRETEETSTTTTPRSGYYRNIARFLV